MRLTAERSVGARDALVLDGLSQPRLEVAVDPPLGHEAPVVALRPPLALHAATLVSVRFNALKNYLLTVDCIY